MAGRTSTNFGMGVAVTVLSLLALGFFVAFAVFYGKYSDRVRQLQEARDQQNEIVRGDERNRDDVRALVEEAKKTGGKSLVGYLIEAQQATMQQVTGSRLDKPSDLANKLTTVPGADSTNLLALINTRTAEIANLKSQLEQAEAARLTALGDLNNEVARVQGIEQRHTQTIDALSAQVGQLRAEVESYRLGADDYKKNIDSAREKETTIYSENEKRLQDQLAKLTEDSLILSAQLAACRGQKNLAIIKPGDEAALVDGEIVGTNSADREAYVSIGAKQKVVLGMTFAVYSEPTAIRPDEEGNYPRGKATLEVIRVGDTASTCRITSEVRGNPIVKGDVIANAIYDPSKQYKFVVFGNFDADRDGLATSVERLEIQNMIAAWGGIVVDDLQGDVDFLVLGERPIVPPAPGSSAPFEVVLEYQRRDREVERYNSLYKQASATAIPIVNENRLYTLIGKTPAAAR